MGNESEVGVSEYMLWHNHKQTSWRQFPWNSLKTFDATNPRWDTKEVPKTGRNLCLVGIISIVLTTETLLAFAFFVEFVTYKFRKLCIDFGFERVWKHWDGETSERGRLEFCHFFQSLDCRFQALELARHDAWRLDRWVDWCGSLKSKSNGNVLSHYTGWFVRVPRNQLLWLIEMIINNVIVRIFSIKFPIPPHKGGVCIVPYKSKRLGFCPLIWVLDSQCFAIGMSACPKKSRKQSANSISFNSAVTVALLQPQP